MVAKINPTISLISPDEIAFDQKNPRGETAEQIEGEEEFKELRKSVNSNGILVPLIVREIKGASKKFRLIDGERRLRAALFEKASLVPAMIIEGGEREGRVLAYNVHMLRKQWDKVCELNSIREIRDELVVHQPQISERDLFKKLREITNHKEHELRDIFALLKYDQQTIRKVVDGELAMSYLVQIDSSFLSPIQREFPSLYSKYGDTELRKILVRKAENGKLGNTRYLMDHVLKFFRDGQVKAKLKNAIEKFLANDDVDIKTIEDKMKDTSAKKEKRKRTKATKTQKSKTKKATTVQSQFGNVTVSAKEQTSIRDIKSNPSSTVGSLLTGKNHCFWAVIEDLGT